jgi:hypothetical protein
MLSEAIEGLVPRRGSGWLSRSRRRAPNSAPELGRLAL